MSSCNSAVEDTVKDLESFYHSPALYLFQVVNVTFFVWIPDSGSIFKVRSHNCLVEKSKAGVIQSSKWSSDYSKESIGFVHAHINMVPKGQLSVKDNTQVYIFGATKNWGTASLRALVFR